jgi:hypothetical protein
MYAFQDHRILVLKCLSRTMCYLALIQILNGGEMGERYIMFYNIIWFAIVEEGEKGMEGCAVVHFIRD